MVFLVQDPTDMIRLGYPDPFFCSLTPSLWTSGHVALSEPPDLHDDPYFYDRVPQQTRRTARGTVET